MKKCPYCAEEIQDAAIVCRFCNRQLSAQKPLSTALTPPQKKGGVGAIYILFGIIGIAVVLAILGSLTASRHDEPPADTVAAATGSPAKDPPPPVDKPEQPPDDKPEQRERLLVKFERAGLIVKRTCIGNEAQVRLRPWLDLDADGKRAVVNLLAAWCNDQHSGDRMTIVDTQSGRKLAETASFGSVTLY